MIDGISALEVVTLFVEDLPATRRFYERVFARPVVFEDAVSAAYRFDNLVINLLKGAEAREVVEPRTVASAAGGVGMLLTIKVNDVDATCQALADHGVVLLNGPVDRPWGRRTAAFADPAGHVWEIAQELAT